MTERYTSTAAGTFLAAVFFLAVPSAASPQPLFEPAFTPYGIDEGMVSPIVEALVQDERGFLWIGTHDGLLRFDGVGFKAYRTGRGEGGSLADDFIFALALADSGRIWVGAERGGLQRFDPLTGEVRHIPLTELGFWRLNDAEGRGQDREGRQVDRIHPFPSGAALLRTDVGLVLYHPVENRAANLMPAWDGPRPLVHATAICPTPDGEALVALSDGSLIVMDDGGRRQNLALALADSLATLTPLPEGYLAATFDGVVYVLDESLSSGRVLLELPNDGGRRRVVHRLLPQAGGTLWIATSAGAFKGDWGTGIVRRLGAGEGARSLPDQDVRDLVADQTGVLWLGTWNGLASMHATSSGMARLFIGTDLEGDGIVAVADAGGGRIWASGLNAPVQLVSRRGGVLAGPSTLPASLSKLPLGDVFSLTGGAAGQPLWIAAYEQGVWVLEGDGPARPVPILDEAGEESFPTIYFVFVDHAGEVWASAKPLGLLRLDRSAGVFRPHRGADPASWTIGSDYAWPIAEDSRGRLWVGAFGGGLTMVSPDRGRATLYRAGPGGLGDDRVLTVFVDSRDRVWVGTEGGGLTRFDPDSAAFTTWTTEDGLPHDNVEAILEDGAGLLWIGTFDGLARFDPSANEFLVFREPAGLAGSRFYANAAYKDADGLLYFGGPAGISIVDPQAIASGGVPPQVALTAFRIQGREVPLARAVRTELLDLEPDENFFAFEFAAMDFADVSQNRYRYRLDPLDADWVNAANTPVANYTSVPEGHYTFRVAARNSDGIWNENALALPVRVQAPYQRTWWFRSLVFAAALSLVAGFYTYRLRQLEARQRLRLEIAGKLHDDIGANLSAIALKAEMVRSLESLDPKRSRQLADVGRLARETAFKVRETVWVVNTQYDTLVGLVGKMHDTADTLLAGHLPYSFDAPVHMPERGISMECRQNVHLLFKETLNNVVKHASASRVDITVGYEGGTLSFRVVDDGVGFDPAQACEGNGQRLMRKRAQNLRGTFCVTSAPGAGTTVDFSARIR